MTVNKAFDKKTSSLFVVGSPFQVLCAAEAIHNFDISDYECLVPLNPTEIRNSQTLELLDYFNIKYKILYSEKRSKIRILVEEIIKPIICSHNYNRVFIGDVYRINQLTLALSNIKRGGSLVYLDDGIATLSIFDGLQLYKHEALHIRLRLINFMAGVRKIKLEKYFFTVYSDYDVDKEKFSIYPNNFSLLEQHLTYDLLSERTVMFVGTNTERYCQCYSLSVEELIKVLFDKLQILKHRFPNCKYVYIPHGRDTNSDVQNVCFQCGFEYTRIPVCIELHLLRNNIRPLAVAGFVSSALFNIKKIFKTENVINFYPVRKSSSFYLKNYNVSKYYERNGIEFLEEIF